MYSFALYIYLCNDSKNHPVVLINTLEQINKQIFNEN